MIGDLYLSLRPASCLRAWGWYAPIFYQHLYLLLEWFPAELVDPPLHQLQLPVFLDTSVPRELGYGSNHCQVRVALVWVLLLYDVGLER